MHSLTVSIPSFRSEDSTSEKGYTVFKIEVLTSGRQHTVEKRYSEFHALHKMLKKIIKPPELPSKHVRNWIPKVLEQRRHGLELYLQTIIMENEVLPKIFLDFLNIRHFPSLPKAESCGSFETESEDSCKLTHQPVLLFLRDPYLLPASNALGGNPPDPAALGGNPPDPAALGGNPPDPAALGGNPPDPA
ncbi:Sorting nexin-24 [Bagarius yarrelli]|uniref:Sorting nexin-24 n=1 Tax=Bagarius yarrelli TaxID=175774 RepID=A0A556U2N9_BAGYA|nr:Sorting nexin-24 [Bagarius yarrelli]